MSSEKEAPRDAVPEPIHMLATGLGALSHEFETVRKGIDELAVQFRPVAERFPPVTDRFRPVTERFLADTDRFLSITGRFRPITERFSPNTERWEKWDTAESLFVRGWVPNRTTPFDLITECGEDDTKLQKLLLAYYTDNWPEVRMCLESHMSSFDVDDEAKATFREALDAHEHGLYRCVSGLLFPQFERVFREALFEGKAGQKQYHDFVKELTGEDGNPKLADVLFAGIQDMVLFKYLTEDVRFTGALDDQSRCAAPKYEPGLAVGVNEENVEQARHSPIPTRHAVAHGLVVYSSQQNSLNAIFIADYVFSIVSRFLRNRSGVDTDNCHAQTDPDGL